MTRFRMAIFFWVCCWSPFFAGPAGARQAPAAGNAGRSQEPFVLEQKTCKIVWESDGTSTQEVSARVRIQSPAAVQEFGLLRFPYASATSSLEIAYVRVRKPGGGVVETPKDSLLDMPAEITRLAPNYSDLKETQVAVRGLDVGDILEYQYRVRDHSPLDRRQFWGQYDFFKQGVVQDEKLQFWVPRDRYVKLRSSRVPYTTSEEGPYRIYTWKAAKLENPQEPTKPNSQEQKPKDPADVMISTFRSWEEVGAWFRGLAGPRAEPTAEIRAKAEDLTRGATSDQQKILAIYKYVATKFRYIGVSLGIGRYQPHSAAEVLANGYGDCKDKHTLLAALLAAAGIPASSALINSATKVDPEIPSPGQFDHVISAFDRGTQTTWMDSTLDVAPLGYLSASLRGKQALLIPAEGAARLVETPADPPFLSALDFEMDGTLDDAGTLTGRVQMTTRGDLEVLLRSAFRQAGPAQWNEVMQRVSGSLGFGGTVSDVSADPPEAADTAFHIRYQYVRKELGDWPNRRVPAPLPPVFLPEAPEASAKNPEPLELGTPTNMKLRARMKLPAGSSPQLPSPLNIKQDFGTYRSSAEFSEGTLIVEREFTQKLRAVPPAEMESYRKFRQSVLEEWTTLIPLHAGAGMEALAPSANSDAQDAFEQGQQAMQQGDTNAALRWFQSAVERDPKFAQAWVGLSFLHFGLGMLSSAAGEMSKAVALNSSLAPRGKMLARELLRSGWREDALPLLRAVEKADPRDADAPKNIATILLGLKRNAEAVAELEAARERFPEDAHLWLLLGDAYVRAGRNADGVSAVHKSVELDPRALNLNDAGYQLAEDNADLEEALKYAERAVGAMEKETEAISLDTIGEQDLRSMARLCAYWDTLGWVYFKMKRLAAAETYLQAAWKLGEDPVVGDHLGQVLEKQGKTEQAGRAYARAVAAGHAPAETLDRLVALRHSRSAATQEVDRARGELGAARSVKLPQLTPQSASADFYLLFEHAAQPKEVRFIKGAESLRAAGDALRAARYDVPFPEEAGTRIVRRGTLSCERTPPGCMLVLIPAAIAQFDAPVAASAPPAAPAAPK